MTTMDETMKKTETMTRAITANMAGTTMTEAEFRSVMKIRWQLSTVTRITTPEGHDDD
jgi:hypothetical protein